MGQITFSCGHTVCYMKRDPRPKRCPVCKYQKEVSKETEGEVKKKSKEIKVLTTKETDNTEFKDAEIEVKKDARPKRW